MTCFYLLTHLIHQQLDHLLHQPLDQPYNGVLQLALSTIDSLTQTHAHSLYYLSLSLSHLYLSLALSTSLFIYLSLYLSLYLSIDKRKKRKSRMQDSLDGLHPIYDLCNVSYSSINLIFLSSFINYFQNFLCHPFRVLEFNV